MAQWTAEVQARRAQALAQSHKTRGQRRLTKDEIRALLKPLGNIRHVLAEADVQDKAEVYQNLGLKLVYEPGKQLCGPRLSSTRTSWGFSLCPRGDLNPHAR
ncbi:hypothetical protein [Streptantibioticus ferralitis]|uniref:Uncharacterized protein n=1 Tax=Streptantibioticus ferralitis TaxID=236510 RepID=A0ABT5Z750_9ACTN|nr:hypothetical protein [Streptantibioticus ferralitis]